MLASPLALIESTYMQFAISARNGRPWWLITTAVCIFLAGNASAQQKPKTPAKLESAAALNAAARQPMLAERITKSFSLIGQKVLESPARRQLAESIKEFETGLKLLQASAPTPEIRENYQLLEQLFDEFKDIKAKPANLENAKVLAEQNEELVWIATKGAQLFQQNSKSVRSDLISKAGEMRTLTQRIAKLYLFRSWGIRTDVIANDLKKAEADYRANFDALVKAPQNTAQIKNELALADTQWIFLKQAIERLNTNKTSVTELEHVSKACDNILEVMERVTKLYEVVKT